MSENGAEADRVAAVAVVGAAIPSGLGRSSRWSLLGGGFPAGKGPAGEVGA
ncbi:hypothetical protein [Streptomyces sp. NPDC048644]|uniref:hypothetical protein n=1 Tax=Streptomyces sp. NPDC048644 TaxID=3365582 RepID=UPI00371534BD